MKYKPFNRIRFGQNLRQARVAAGLTQAELARKAGLSENTISRLERGLCGMSVLTFVALVNALETRPAHLLSGIE